MKRRKVVYVCRLKISSLLKRFKNLLLHWELWPFYVIYTPLGLVWLYYFFRSGAFWFFSNVNPTLEFSGFEGESKREMYDQIPCGWYPPTVYVTQTDQPECLSCRIDEAGIRFPLVAKPNVGMQGLMFRKLSTEKELIDYHNHIGADYLIQKLCDLPEEYSVFYIRYPGEKKGNITGLILKDYLSVTGDGTSTLLKLIESNERASFRKHELILKHQPHLNEVIANGEKYYLSIAGNHNRGARFINLHREIDEQLHKVFDKIGAAMPNFYYGRYDVKCTSLSDLKRGKNIQILEFNGTGSEPNHIYDCGMSYFAALKVIARHWHHMYRIGKINQEYGIPYWSFWKGKKHLNQSNRFFKKLRHADLTFRL